MNRINPRNWSSIVVGVCCLTLTFWANAACKSDTVGVTGESKKAADRVALVLAEVNFTDLVEKNTDRTFDVEGAIKVDVTGARALFDQGAFFVDSRANYRYDSGHIPGATNLIGVLYTQVSFSQLVGPEQEVVFYCGGEDCRLSAYASARALTWGYTRVYYFAGGYPAWKKAGFAVELP